MDLKIVNTGNTTNISTISTTVSTTTPSNITVIFKLSGTNWIRLVKQQMS